MTKKTVPTKSEIEVLKILWRVGPSSVRAVNNDINLNRKVSYTSTLKTMQIMAEKGLLTRNESSMKHIYYPAEEEATTKKYLTQNFIDNVFNGSTSKLILELLGGKSTGNKDLKEIEQLLKKHKIE